jgi:hypothetical protein
MKLVMKGWRYELPSTDQILTELIHKLINSIWGKEKLPEHWKEVIIVPIYKKGDEIDLSN